MVGALPRCAGHFLSWPKIAMAKLPWPDGYYNSSTPPIRQMKLALIFRLRILIWVCALFSLESSLVAQTAPDRIAQIAALLREQQYNQALQMLDGAVRQYPGYAELWTMQGVAYNGLDKKKEALGAFRRALKLSPDTIPALQGAAQLEYDSADPAGIPLLERLLRLRPNDVTSHGMLAILEYQLGHCEAAVVHFEKAAALFASRIPALHAYGTCLVKLRQFDRATEVFQNSLSLDPDDHRERQVLASVQLMSHRPEQAIVTMAPLLSTTPDAATLELASAAYEDARDTDKAVEMLRKAILIDPRNVTLYVNFAALSATHQSVQVGIDVVNDGINLQPKAAPLYFARGVLYVQLADYDKAQADFEKAYELDPSQSLSSAAQGLIAMQQSDAAGALASVREKLTRRPDDPVLLYLEADILAQEGPEPGSPDFQTALRSAKKAVTLRPTLGAAHGVLAKLYLESGQYTQAAIHCRKALEVDPKDQGSLYRLVQALRKDGKNEEIPGLLKQLAVLRQQANRDQREQNRFKLVEGDAESK